MSKAYIEPDPTNQEFALRRRETSIKVLDIAREYLEGARVQRSLGHLSRELIEVSYMAEVPYVAMGRIFPLTNYTEREVFPFTLMRGRETLVNSMVERTPMQRQMFLQRAVEIDQYTILEPPVDVEYSATIPDRCNGATWGVAEDWSEHEGLVCATRPLVGIRPSSLRTMALTAVHEISHAHDALTEPLSRQSGYISRVETELKAFSVDYKVDTLTSSNGKGGDSITKSVAMLRQHYNGSFNSKDAFHASDELIKALIKHGAALIWK